MMTNRSSRSSQFLWMFLGVVLVAAFASSALAQGKKPDSPGGGSKETVANNLSYPAAHTVDLATSAVWNVPAGALGVNYSYGCDKPETIGTNTYPNTSCVDAVGNVLPFSVCTGTGGKCQGYTVDRIYWQKVEGNDWWAQTVGPTGSQSPSNLDWGDNLESTTWKTTSTIRVETTPFVNASPALRGYQMWHVFGQGTNEQWGVRATDQTTPRPYVYQSPFAIIHTSGARLNLAKLEAGATTCPTTALPNGSGIVLPWTGSAWLGAKQLRDVPYTAELNVGGKYVYGYNWALKRDEVAPWDKAGWWRLTFYTPDRSVLFNNSIIPIGPPPAVPGEPALSLVGVTASEGPKYAPKIDVANNLTYIDICIQDRVTGGGGSGGGGGPK